MSHEIETMFAQDRDASYADKVGTDTWHGLGTKIPHDKRMNAEETIAACGWPTTIKVRGTIPNPITGQTEPMDSWGIVRTDNGKQLGSVKKKYTVWSPENTMKTLAPWIESGNATPHTGGTLKEGRILWLLLKINIDAAEVVPGDPIFPFLLYSQGTCGNLTHQLGFTIHRPVCFNTLMPALRDKDKSHLIKVRHTENQGKALGTIAENMDLATRQMIATQEALRIMADTGANPRDLARYFRLVAKTTKKKSEVVDLDCDINDLCGKSQTRLTQLYAAIAKPGGMVAPGTVYQAYNAATWYLSHEAVKTADSRVEGLWFKGSGNVAFDAAIAWANAKQVVAA